MRFGAIVLAAGSGSRFGGGKLLALLDGRPVLAHVLDALATADPAATVVVLGADAAAVERAIAWRGELRVVNPDPSRGLASSLRIGVEAATAVSPPLDALVIALGDQPRLQPAVIAALVAAAAAPDAPPFTAPRYAGEPAGVRNPVVVRRDAWPRIATLDGDRGLGPLLARDPALVRVVAVDGSNPDIDTPEDLARIAGGG